MFFCKNLADIIHINRIHDSKKYIFKGTLSFRFKTVNGLNFYCYTLLQRLLWCGHSLSLMHSLSNRVQYWLHLTNIGIRFIFYQMTYEKVEGSYKYSVAWRSQTKVNGEKGENEGDFWFLTCLTSPIYFVETPLLLLLATQPL